MPTNLSYANIHVSLKILFGVWYNKPLQIHVSFFELHEVPPVVLQT
jgi:hypothetical protein